MSLLMVEKLGEEGRMDQNNKASSPTHEIADAASGNAAMNGNRGNQGLSHNSVDDIGRAVKHPYIGKRVRVRKGPHKGVTGRILKISRGYWAIDHPQLQGRTLHSDMCEWIDKVGAGELAEYYSQLNRRMSHSPMGSVAKSVNGESQASKDGVIDKYDCNGDTHLYGKVNPEEETGSQIDGGQAVDFPASEGVIPATSVAQHETESANTDEQPARHIASSPSSGGLPRRKRRRSSDSSCESSSVRLSGGPSSNDLHAIDSLDTLLVSQRDVTGNTTAVPPRLSQYNQGGSRHIATLPPVVLDERDGRLSSVAHLPQHSKVEIFDRRTGKIMSGEDAVTVKDLAEVLSCHAEYEPIIPPQPSSQVATSSSVSFREGRSSANVRVSGDVNPQVRYQNSSFEGKSVVVTRGPYRGLVGRIDGCVPGGWYLVEGIFREDDLGLKLVVSPDNVELIPEPDENEKNQAALEQDSSRSQPENGGSFVKEFQGFLTKHFSAPIRSLKLRIEALKKEKKDLDGELLKRRLARAAREKTAGDASKFGAVPVESQEERRLRDRLHHIQCSLTKAESDLREQVQSAGAARIHVLQCFDQAEHEGT